jgi:hypothetical protein
MISSRSEKEWVLEQCRIYPSPGSMPDALFFKIRPLADKIKKLVLEGKNFEHTDFRCDLEDWAVLFPQLEELEIKKCTINGKAIKTSASVLKYFRSPLKKWSIVPLPPRFQESNVIDSYEGPRFAPYLIDGLFEEYLSIDGFPQAIRARARSLALTVCRLTFSSKLFTNNDLTTIASWFPKVDELFFDRCFLNGKLLTNKTPLERIFRRTLNCDFKWHRPGGCQDPINLLSGQLSACTIGENGATHRKIVPKKPLLLPSDKSPTTGVYGLTENCISHILSYLPEPVKIVYNWGLAPGTFTDVENFLTVYKEELKPMSLELFHEAAQSLLPRKVVAKEPKKIEDSLTRLMRVASSAIIGLDLRRFEGGKDPSLSWLDRVVTAYPNVTGIFLPKSTITRPYVELLKKIPDKNLTVLDTSCCIVKDSAALAELAGLENLFARRFYEIHSSFFLSQKEEQAWTEIFYNSVSGEAQINLGCLLDDQNIQDFTKMTNLQRIDLGVVSTTVTSKALELLGARLPHLLEFSIEECPVITDRTLRAFSGHDFILLSLINCHSINDEAIEIITKQFPALGELRIGSSALTDRSFSLLSNLKVLRNLLIANHDGITFQGWRELQKCENLEKLVVTSANNFNDKMFLACSTIPRLSHFVFANFIPPPLIVRLFRLKKPPETCRLIPREILSVIQLDPRTGKTTPLPYMPPVLEADILFESTQERKQVEEWPLSKGDIETKQPFS